MNVMNLTQTFYVVFEFNEIWRDGIIKARNKESAIEGAIVKWGLTKYSKIPRAYLKASIYEG